MNPDWQSIAAPAVAGLTLAVFIWRWFRQRTRGGVAGSCAGCSCSPAVKPPGH
jgi:hypothetical protein